MPLIDLYAPADLLGRAALERLAADVLEAVHHEEGYAGSGTAAALSWTYLHELPQGQPMMGMGPSAVPLWRIEIAAPEGSLSADAKARVSAVIERLVLDAEGGRIPPGTLPRVWCLFRDAAEGTWFAGRTAASAAAIRAAVGRERRAAASAR